MQFQLPSPAELLGQVGRCQAVLLAARVAAGQQILAHAKCTLNRMF